MESSGQYISAIYRHLQMIINAQLEPYNIGSGQYIFLMAIHRMKGVSQKRLSEELLIDKTTTAKAMLKLEEEGYIDRKIHPDDKRVNQLFLTEKGKHIMPVVGDTLSNLVNLSRQGISEEESSELIRLLKLTLINLRKEVLMMRDDKVNSLS